MSRRSPLLVVFLTVFLDLLGFGIVLPIAAYYVEALGGTPTATTWLGAVYSLMQFLFAPIWGRLSDRIGRRPIILMSVAGSCLSYLMFGFANSLALLILSRALAGVMAANISTAQAYVADVTTPENRTKGMGLIGAAFGLGFVFGPAIGAALSGTDPTGRPSMVVPLVASGLSLVNWVLAYFFLPESLKAGGGTDGARPQRAFGWFQLQRALSHPRVGLPILLFFLSTLAFAGMEWTLTSFLKHQFQYTARDAGKLFAWGGVLIAVVQGGLVGRMAKGSREPVLLAAGTLLMAVGLALVPSAPSTPALMGVLALLAFGQGITHPSASSLISRSTEATEQGMILGVSQGMSSLARAIGPAASGWLIAVWGLSAPFLAGGAVMALAFLVSLRVLAHSRQRGVMRDP